MSRTEVAADAERIRQVIAHYLSNAIASSRREQPIAVSLTCESGAARVAVRDLRDRGPGIPLDQQVAILGSLLPCLYRVSGVSLALSTNTAPASAWGWDSTSRVRSSSCHGGAVALASAPGEGATFAFTLPLAAASDASSET